MGRLLQESLVRVQQDIQFASRESLHIGKRFPDLQIGIFQFDHGRRLRHSIEGLLGEIEPLTHATVRREVASTAVKLLAIENVRRRGLSDDKVNTLIRDLHDEQIDDADRKGIRRININTQWEIAARLASVLTVTAATVQQLSSLKEPLIDATALEVDSLSRE